ncbi:hypothetical protein [Corynebacterium aquilae]|uniref:Uncharacterized protein n=1 Tax=Corynebacterium aquilae DSM 44791 TaxID=1431546 RepID=A0A1L7CET6_9CORY|nr:hypothetical protein [Corynebacterium aquilae]APT84390.1 hypothetical protein CAQU_04120 [Corynebacterium aquilae DSM 44791]
MSDNSSRPDSGAPHDDTTQFPVVGDSGMQQGYPQQGFGEPGPQGGYQQPVYNQAAPQGGFQQPGYAQVPPQPGYEQAGYNQAPMQPGFEQPMYNQAPPAGFQQQPMYNQPPMPGYAMPAQQPPKKSNTGLIIGLVLVALLIIGAVAAYFMGAFGLVSDEVEVETSTVTVDEITPVAPPVEAPPVQKVTPQAGWTHCGSGYGMSVYAGTGVTSCPFSMNVYNSLGGPFTGGQRVVDVYSPVTGRTYTMTCTNNGGWFTCRGGNNAVVHILPS